MKVGLIADMLDFGYRGVGVYTYNLVSGLLKIDKGNRYFVIHNENSRCPKGHKHLFDRTKEIKIRQLPPFSNKYETERLITRLRYPRVLKKEGFDIIHDTTNLYALTPDSTGIKTVVTVHEVTDFATTLLDKLVVRLSFRSLKKIKDNLEDCHLIAVSHNTKKHLMRYGIPSRKVSVVHNGVNHEVFRPMEMKVGKPFILYVGSNAPRKNIPTLLRSFYLLKKNKDLPHKLVLVSYPNKILTKLTRSLNIKQDVVFRSNISDKELCRLYNSADLFVLPSLFEGFGMPPLEAMSCGCPVITSNVASLPEIVGDAGVTVNPNDAKSLANTMNEVIANEGLREKLRRKGLERANFFSWERTAKETLKVYKDAFS